MTEDHKPPPLSPNPLGPSVRQRPSGEGKGLPYTVGVTGAAIGEQPKEEDVGTPSWATPWSGVWQGFSGSGGAVLAYWLCYGLAMAFGTLEAAYSPSRQLAPIFEKMGSSFDSVPPFWEAFLLGPVYGLVINFVNANLWIVLFGGLEMMLFIAFIFSSWRTRPMLGLVTIIVVLLNLLALVPRQ